MPMLSDLTAAYLKSVPAQQQTAQQQELLRFRRWLGDDRPPESLTARDVEGYQDYLIANRMDLARAVPPLKSFLAFAERTGAIPYKLARYLKPPRSAAASTRKGGNAAQAAARANDRPATVLTADGHAALEAELKNLSTVERARIAQALREARADRDIRENAPYDAAKQHQAMVEARIRELEAILATAEVLRETPVSERVAIGSTIVLRDLNEDDELRYTLVSTNEANPRLGKLSVASPVGKALLDRLPGETVEVTVPAGTLRYRIEQIESA
ncbi:MAG: transcription elongation factor GreA [Chloroflexi bacterium]|nr:transcription elongation factor GreA [Chloroflexota bacterium]MBI4504485.1 transcription elongation factor GreA [Chloroflexota bacterium]